MSNTIINISNAALEERIEACFSCCTNRMVHLQELPFWILWHLWKSRNQLIFQQKQMHWKSLIQLAKTNAKEWKDMVVEDPESNFSRHTSPYSRSDHKFWRKPPDGWIKCNVDGLLLGTTIDSRADWVLRDDAGRFVGAVQSTSMRV